MPKILSEVGTDISRWPTEKHFVSCLALCPDNRESAGHRKSGRTRRSTNRAAAVFRVAAQGLHHSKSALGAYLRRMQASVGAPKAITATARKVALLVSRALKSGMQFIDPGQDWYEQDYPSRVLKSLTRRARDLGFQRVPASLEVAD